MTAQGAGRAGDRCDETSFDIVSHVMAGSTGVVTAEHREGVLDATLALIARGGVAKTTVGDIARESGCSRATLYRSFPGGRGEVLDALVRREVALAFTVITGALDAAADLHVGLADSLTAAAVHLRDHRAVRTVLADEPHLAVPVIGFGEAEVLYRAVRRVVAPHLARWLPATQAPWVAEWMARLFLSAAFDPDDTLDLSDPAVSRRVVDTFVIPALAREPALDLTDQALAPSP